MADQLFLLPGPDPEDTLIPLETHHYHLGNNLPELKVQIKHSASFDLSLTSDPQMHFLWVTARSPVYGQLVVASIQASSNYFELICSPTLKLDHWHQLDINSQQNPWFFFAEDALCIGTIDADYPSRLKISRIGFSVLPNQATTI